MGSKKKLLALVPIVVAIISLLGGGQSTNWTFDFSQDHSVTISEGDTIDKSQTTNFWDFGKDMLKESIQEFADEEICNLDPIPENYIERCLNQ